jgi:hypothetical protein
VAVEALPDKAPLKVVAVIVFVDGFNVTPLEYLPYSA